MLIHKNIYIKRYTCVFTQTIYQQALVECKHRSPPGLQTRECNSSQFNYLLKTT